MLFQLIMCLGTTGQVEKSADAQNLLAACGIDIPASSETLSDLEQFVIHYVYFDEKSKTLADVRASKWRDQKKKSITRLAPDTDSLRQHLERANYLAYVQTHYQLKQHPSPLGHGWHLLNGLCLPVRYTQPSVSHTIALHVDNTAEGRDHSDSDSSSSSDGYTDSTADEWHE